MKPINQTNSKGQKVDYWEYLDGDGNFWYFENYDQEGNLVGESKIIDKAGTVIITNRNKPKNHNHE